MSSAPEPIAIVGIGCRLPGGVHDAESFWQLLIDGVDAIAPIERDGFDLDRLYSDEPRTPGHIATRWGGMLSGLEDFDAAFFGISPREAAALAPEQRLLLESAWEAFEDATIDPHSVDGRPGAVFVGQWLNEFEDRLFADPDQIDFYATTGSGRYATSGRLSYAFGLTGPSVTVDTACSSSLVAVHLACQSLRSGESEIALAAGVNVILEPHITIAYSQSGMMTPSGRCRFGDADGDGYVRSEGAVVVVLKRLADAVAAGDPIRAVIRGSAVNNDGRGSGLLATPSRDGQAELLRRAYASAGVDPTAVGYVEAHGTGTRAGDPVELGAIADVIALGRDRERALLVGSVKTNIGHTEGAAGLAGLVKSALALEHGVVPASLHLEHPNPAVPWASVPIVIPQQPSAWPHPAEAPRYAGISGFGITGTNAHVVLEAAAGPTGGPRRAPARARERLPLVISAASEPALRASAGRLADVLAAHADWTVPDVCASAARHRAALEHRAAFVVGSVAEAAAQLRAFATGDDTVAAATGRARPGVRRVAFVFPGQGGQSVGMGRELLAGDPAFAAAIDACDAALPADAGFGVREQLLLGPGDPGYRLDEIGVLQPTLLAFEIALAATWRSIGIEPAAAIGHSMGEVGAAHLAGALDLTDAMRIICTRSALMQRTAGLGAMALVGVSAEQAAELIGSAADRVGVAVVNSPGAVVVSGEPDAVAAIVAAAEGDGRFARLVNVDVASHSPQMEPLVGELTRRLADLEPRRETLALYSTVTAERSPGERLDAAYWGANLRRPVRFGPTLAAMLADRFDAYIELGPHPALLTSIAEVAGDADVVAVGSLRRDAPEHDTLIAALGAAWCRGVAVEWGALFPADSYRRLRLGHYAWQRQRHWGTSAQARPATDGHRPAGLSDELAGHVYQLRWEPVAEPVAGAVADTWLIVGSGAWTVAAARDLTAAGANVTAVADTAAAATELTRLAAEGVVPALAVDAEGSDTYRLVEQFRALLHAWPERAAATPRIRWVTTGAHSVSGEPLAPDAPQQAASWGAARVIGSEYPGWWGGVVDVPAEPVPVGALAGALNVPAGDLVAVRADGLWARRLEAADPPAPASPPWRRDAAYLITGGLGGVGLELARELIDRGVRRLVLLGRTELPPRAEWADTAPDSPVGRRIAAVRELEHLGAAVHLLVADVADEAQLATALHAYAGEGWPPIAGVVHAAGVLAHQLVEHADAGTCASTIAPKLGGALLLDRLLPDVDVFVTMSSMAGFWGTPGLVAYAAANAGLDALAEQRRQHGRHALSIQWGPWRGVGMHGAQFDARANAEFEADGMAELASADARRLLSALVVGTAATAAVLDLDPERLARGPRRAWPLFAALGGRRADSGAVDSGLAAAIAAADPLDRVALLDQAVRAVAGSVLRAVAADVDAHRPLGSLGLDSLMALELRNRLAVAVGRELPASLAWNYPTIAALVDHLAALVAAADTHPGTESTPAAADVAPPASSSPDTDGDLLGGVLGQLAALSDDDAASALRGGRP